MKSSLPRICKRRNLASVTVKRWKSEVQAGISGKTVDEFED
jgi:hypothetical protein